MTIQNQNILITGGTSGIGKAIALSLKEKNTVIITGRHKSFYLESLPYYVTKITDYLGKKPELEDLKRIKK